MPSILLLAGDDRTIADVIGRCFDDGKLRIHSATSAGEALDVVGRFHPDLVVLDIVLPDGSGLATFEELRKRDPSIPAVFLTASGTSETAIAATTFPC